PCQEEPSGCGAGPDSETLPREDVDPSGLRSPSGELRKGVGKRIARDRQDDPREDGRRAGDAGRESGDDEDAGSEQGTDVESDGVTQGDDSMKPGRGSRWLVEIWCGGGCHGSRPLTPSCSFAVRRDRRDGVDGRQAASTASMALSISFCNFVRAAAFAHKSERSGLVAR